MNSFIKFGAAPRAHRTDFPLFPYTVCGYLLDLGFIGVTCDPRLAKENRVQQRRRRSSRGK